MTISALRCGLVLATMAATAAAVSVTTSTVRYSGDGNQLFWKISDSPADGPAAATLEFGNGFMETGWDQIIVTADPGLLKNEPELAYYGAGYIEGYTTARQIFTYFSNMDPVKDPMNSPWMENQLAWVTAQLNSIGIAPSASSTVADRFKWQAKLMVQQFRGMLAGYNAASAGVGGHDLAPIELWRLTMVMNLYPNSTKRPGAVPAAADRGKCTTLVKVTHDDLFFAHSMWYNYQTMTRMYKTYRFETNVSFSGYPGVVCSCNDFYMTSNDLAVIETSLPNYNLTAFAAHASPLGLPPVMRSMIASALANTCAEWAAYFAVWNSGTDDGSYFVVDMKLFTPNTTSLAANLAWAVEQGPASVTAADVTPQLQAERYLASYNIPFFKSVFDASLFPMQVAKFGDWFSLERNQVGLQFKARHAAVTDLASMKAIMRYNEYKTDPLSLIQNCSACDPKMSALLAIGGRGDVNPLLGDYGALREVLGPWAYGNIDVKIGSYKSMLGGALGATIINGPVYSDAMPAFRWSTSGFAATVNHTGMPDLMKWDWVAVAAAGIPHNATAAPSTMAGKALNVLLLVGAAVLFAGAVVFIVFLVKGKTAAQAAEGAGLAMEQEMRYGTAAAAETHPLRAADKI
jgi:hypothetical protein